MSNLKPRMKHSRSKEILDIIQNEVVGSQEELMQKLNERGYQQTQATLSRNLKELSITKTRNSMGKLQYVIRSAAAFTIPKMNSSTTSLGFVSLAFSNGIAVVRTLPGYASMIAGAIDHHIGGYTLGSIAGDDTIFIVINPEVEQEEFLQQFSNHIAKVD